MSAAPIGRSFYTLQGSTGHQRCPSLWMTMLSMCATGRGVIYSLSEVDFCSVITGLCGSLAMAPWRRPGRHCLRAPGMEALRA